MTGNTLYHYGVKGMKWGVRRSNKYVEKAKHARESANEWDDISSYQTAKLRAKGKTDKAAKREAYYKSAAAKDRADAAAYEAKANKIMAAEKGKDKFREARKEVSQSRQLGHKLATNVLAGAFANRTYNSVLAAGGSRVKAAGVTAATALLGGPIGHLAVSALYTYDAGDNSARRAAKRR